MAMSSLPDPVGSLPPFVSPMLPLPSGPDYRISIENRSVTSRLFYLFAQTPHITNLHKDAYPVITHVTTTVKPESIAIFNIRDSLRALCGTNSGPFLKPDVKVYVDVADPAVGISSTSGGPFEGLKLYVTMDGVNLTFTGETGLTRAWMSLQTEHYPPKKNRRVTTNNDTIPSCVWDVQPGVQYDMQPRTKFFVGVVDPQIPQHTSIVVSLPEPEDARFAHVDFYGTESRFCNVIYEPGGRWTVQSPNQDAVSRISVSTMDHMSRISKVLKSREMVVVENWSMLEALEDDSEDAEL
ncbi:hypothetical protein MMC18_006609 [Xylographa bjoerkii]|nr:hypothetical protein [Xylographa bjoerkii]